MLPLYTEMFVSKCRIVGIITHCITVIFSLVKIFINTEFFLGCHRYKFGVYFLSNGLIIRVRGFYFIFKIFCVQIYYQNWKNEIVFGLARWPHRAQSRKDFQNPKGDKFWLLGCIPCLYSCFSRYWVIQTIAVCTDRISFLVISSLDNSTANIEDELI